MSQRYKGAVISATPPTVSATSPNAYGTAKGVWTLQQQMQYEGAGTWPNPFTPVYIEDVFSTWIYTGNGSTQTITNGIDLSTNGGLVWIKQRSSTYENQLFDTVRGGSNYLISDTTGAQNQYNYGNSVSFLSSGFSTTGSPSNQSSASLVSWTFREQPKFFDVVTWTGDGTSGRSISHSLGSTPGCIIIKRYDSGSFSWLIFHRSLQDGLTGSRLVFDTAAATNGLSGVNIQAADATTITLGSVSTNTNGGSFVAYLFAHDAGGFGLTGSDNVISCGSWTGNTSVNLGYEPQWILIKKTDSTSNWFLLDVMRGWTAGGILNFLLPNSSAAESTSALSYLTINSTGFAPGSDPFFQTGTFIYIAIRRGPMKTPTSGTSVFDTNINSTTNPFYQTTTAGPVDAAIAFYKPGYDTGTDAYPQWGSRLTGGRYLQTPNDRAEITGTYYKWDYMNGWNNYSPSLGSDFGTWMFKRAPGFFDVVCYDGNSVSGRSVNHNLGVAPELIIVKSRNAATNWGVYCQPLGNTKRLILNLNVADNADSSYWNNTSPTSSVFYVGNSPNVNTTSQSYVAYLFATVAGVSKVGSYTGTGALQTINCEFTTGARFVLIKRTNSTGDWWVYDSARGISSSNDPYLWLNSTNSEVSNTNYVDTTSVGFQINTSAPDGLNANGSNYIFLAIA